jgi:hypothetical protein
MMTYSFSFVDRNDLVNNSRVLLRSHHGDLGDTGDNGARGDLADRPWRLLQSWRPGDWEDAVGFSTSILKAFRGSSVQYDVWAVSRKIISRRSTSGFATSYPLAPLASTRTTNDFPWRYRDGMVATLGVDLPTSRSLTSNGSPMVNTRSFGDVVTREVGFPASYPVWSRDSPALNMTSSGDASTEGIATTGMLGVTFPYRVRQHPNFHLR